MDLQGLDEKLRKKIEDQLIYLNQMRDKYFLCTERDIIYKFGDILCELKKNKIDIPTAISRLSKLLKDDYEMIEGFNAILPFDVRIEIQRTSPSKPAFVSFKWITSPGSDELNRQLKSVIEDTEDFVGKVYECYLNQGISFKSFKLIIKAYRVKKSNLDDEMFAESVLLSELKTLLQNQDELLKRVCGFRILDYLSVVSFYVKFTPSMYGEMSGLTKFEKNRVFFAELIKIVNRQPGKFKKYVAVIDANAKKLLHEEEYDVDAVKTAFAKILEGRDDLLALQP